MSIRNVATQFASGLRLFIATHTVPIPDGHDFEDLTFAATVRKAKAALPLPKRLPYRRWLLCSETDFGGRPFYRSLPTVSISEPHFSNYRYSYRIT